MIYIYLYTPFQRSFTKGETFDLRESNTSQLGIYRIALCITHVENRTLAALLHWLNFPFWFGKRTGGGGGVENEHVRECLSVVFVLYFVFVFCALF